MITAPVEEDRQTATPGVANPPWARKETVLQFACPFCRLVLEVSAELVGVRGPCPGCGEEIEAPAGTNRTLPDPIAIEPRCPSPKEPERAGHDRPRGLAEPLPMPALGVPPPVPPPPPPNPPIPRQAPIPPQPTVSIGASTLEERLEWGVSPQARRRSRSRPGRSIDPTSPFSMSYRNRKEFILTIKAVLAILATAAIAIAIAVFTKKSVLNSSGKAPSSEAVERVRPS